jgi:hypothetical protein
MAREPGRGGTALGLDIEVLGAPGLRRSADPVAAVDTELRHLVQRMFDTMYGAHGQGLAAPQVGRSIRLAVVDVPPAGPPYVLINPRITWTSRERARGVEGWRWSDTRRPHGGTLAMNADTDEVVSEVREQVARPE